jgi:PEP-CTERM motif
MSIRFAGKMLAGAVALALAGGAFASTNADNSGTVVLNIIDLGTGTPSTSYVFDTGLSVDNFASQGSYSQSLASDPNFISFKNSIQTGDNIEYNLGGGSTSGVNALSEAVFTSTSTPVAQSGQNTDAARAAFNNFLGTVKNNNGSSTFIPASANSAGQWVQGGYDGNLTSNAGVSGDAVPGTSMAFYELSTNKPTKTTPGTGSEASFAGIWSLNLNTGLLQYQVSQVPLPAPLVLLLSGLGLMGVVARRGKGSGVNLDGAAA